jgi:hypothetical protein
MIRLFASIMSARSSACRHSVRSGHRNRRPGARQCVLGYSDSGEPAKAVTPSDNAARAAWLWSIRETVSETNPAGLYLWKRGYKGTFLPTARRSPLVSTTVRAS